MSLTRSALVALVLAACARTPVSPAQTTAPDAWRAQTWEERHDVMTFAVLPTMSRLFQRFNATPYPDTTCKTCHGDDAEDVAYRMPHGLPPLDPRHLPDARDPDPRVARVARFMADEVTPRMADILETHVTCFTCHPAKSD